MRLKNKKYKNLWYIEEIKDLKIEIDYIRKNNLPVEGSHSTLTVKNLDYYDNYYSGYGLYDKLKNMVDNDNLSML